MKDNRNQQNYLIMKYCFSVLLLSCILLESSAWKTKNKEPNLYFEQTQKELSKGDGVFIYNSYKPFENRPIEVHYYIPDTTDISDMPIIFVFEGGDRNYTYLLDAWKKEAKKRGFIVFIPHFGLKEYPLSDYQEIGVMDKNHNIVKPINDITPVLIDHIFEYICQHLKTKQKGYSIYGHSAGGQFVQRFMLFHESKYVENAIIGSPGWYTLPSQKQTYPYGIKNIPYIDSVRIKKYLSLPIVLQLASGDTIRESYLRKTPEAEKQGVNRLERGINFYNYLSQLAQKQKWSFNWKLKIENGIGHKSVEMGERAIKIFFNDSLYESCKKYQ